MQNDIHFVKHLTAHFFQLVETVVWGRGLKRLVERRQELAMFQQIAANFDTEYKL